MVKLRILPTIKSVIRHLFINFLARYDVELYQRIEQLIEKRLPKFDVVEEEVMMLVERVTEAQRFAKMVSGWIFSNRYRDYSEFA